jgi:hypothetical protein
MFDYNSLIPVIQMVHQTSLSTVVFSLSFSLLLSSVGIHTYMQYDINYQVESPAVSNSLKYHWYIYSKGIFQILRIVIHDK